MSSVMMGFLPLVVGALVAYLMHALGEVYRRDAMRRDEQRVAEHMAWHNEMKANIAQSFKPVPKSPEQINADLHKQLIEEYDRNIGALRAAERDPELRPILEELDDFCEFKDDLRTPPKMQLSSERVIELRSSMQAAGYNVMRKVVNRDRNG